MDWGAGDAKLTIQSVVCYTSFTYSYLSRAGIMARTLREAHPGWAIWAVIVDRPPPGTDMSRHLAVFDRIVAAEDLGIPEFRSWIFKHNVVEACTAVKARMMMQLFDAGFGKVIYLDPDIGVFHPLTDIESTLDTRSIILTPHQVEPNDTRMAIADNELAALKYGIYNLGFIAVRNDATGRAFAAWWDGMLREACYEEVESGIYTDQKYCDIVPALFPGVHIERDPGCNVASWNLSRRRIEITRDGAILVNGSPLKFYHFTKIDSVGDVMTERYAGANHEVMEIWFWYKRQLQGSIQEQLPGGYWHYGRFSNGEPIPEAARLRYRRTTELRTAFPDPFDVSDSGFYQWLQNHPEPGGAPTTAANAPVSEGPDYFDAQWYIASNPDVAGAIAAGTYRSAIEHYARFGFHERRMPRRIIVDEDFYLQRYADVREAIAEGRLESARQHFELCGYWEGRLPGPDGD